ncbi:MAG TPA: aminopeptidase P family protein [Solirubrobacteraceae bacterium]
MSASTSLQTDIASQLERRRRTVAERWNLGSEAVLIGAGDPIHIPGRADLTYPFRAHSEYFYLTDRERPGGVLAFDPDEGWIDFVVPVSRDELVWEGAPADAQEGVPIAELEPWLAARRDRPIVNLGAPVAGVPPADELAAELRRHLNYVRREKDAVELERMRAAERATRAGFASVVPLLSAGRTERAVRIELEAEFFRQGADELAFETIVAGGANSGVLHFPPTARPLQDGELVLIDAGGEFRGYASDVTRTYPVSGSFTPEQAAVHEIVRRAGEAATERAVPGTEFRDIHRTAALAIAEGLTDFGLLRGGPDVLVESGAVSLFFPHGIGHMVGLGVRDAGEVLPGREPEPGLPRIRADLPLLAGHTLTIEPGIYFIPALLADPDTRARLRQHVDWERADALLGFGGVRIEHNVLLTDEGPEILTADIPILG